MSPQTPVILGTGYVGDAELAAIRDAGADDLLLKPYEMRDLLERLPRVAGARKERGGTSRRSPRRRPDHRAPHTTGRPPGAASGAGVAETIRLRQVARSLASPVNPLSTRATRPR